MAISIPTKSSNPVFSDKGLNGVLDAERGIVVEPMTVGGAINKTFILTGIMLIGAVVGISIYDFVHGLGMRKILTLGCALGGGIIFFITSMNPQRAPMLAPIYAFVKGLFVGVVSLMYMSLYSGIVFQAFTLTMGTLFTMLALYKSGLVKVTQKFRAGVSMAVGAVMIYYLINIVLSFFGVSIPFIHDGGMLSIGLCCVILVIASMNLLLDFDNFDKGAERGAPKYMEWFYGMGLLFTLIWLYIEFLRLLSYLNND